MFVLGILGNEGGCVRNRRSEDRLVSLGCAVFLSMGREFVDRGTCDAMGNDIFQFKPNFHGIGVDFNALWKKVRKQPASPFEKVAARFVELFAHHGVAVTQIPRLLPSIGLAQLVSPASLLAALTPEVLQKACALFGVRYEWIEGTSDQIYEHRFCYKVSYQFFEELDALAPAAMIAPVRAFTTDKQLDYRSSNSQRLELVLVERIAWMGDIEVVRYRPF